MCGCRYGKVNGLTVMASTNHRKRARSYQRAHGVSYTVALRAVTAGDGWSNGITPWLRQSQKPFNCYWCGSVEAILSWGDIGEDTERIEFYCQNPDCNAREVDVLVVDDGTDTTRRRADAKALQRFPGEVLADPVLINDDEQLGWMVRTSPLPSARTSGQVQCLFCGKQTCDVDPAGDSDIGRLTLYCRNPRCAADTAIALVGRDGTPATQNREDVTALREIDNPPPPPSADGAPRIRPVGHRTDGVLDRRRG
ncbi:hypothetical protein A5786_17030 [Gordonia sp. 852002-50816_SCH5313054-a]|nr:hypothetical protein A5786_17030 [Gordonia sp. 852002-50816_SCH5313054-a]